MSKALTLSAVFAAAAAIGWVIGTPPSPSPKPILPKAEIPPRPDRKLTRAQVDADPAYDGALERIRTAATTKDRLQYTYDLAHSIPDEDVGKWLSGDLFKEGDLDLVAFFRSVLFGRYSAIDPADCAVIMMKNREPGAKAHLQRWAAGNSQAVLEIAAKTTDRQLRGSLLDVGLTELAKSDPAAALALLAKEPDTFVQLDGMMASISGANRQMVLDWADDPRRETHRDRARTSIAKAWFGQDFNGALAWAREQEDGAELISAGLYRLGLPLSGYLDKLGSLPPDLTVPALTKALKSGDDLDEWLNHDYEGKNGFTPAQAKAVRMSAIERLAFVDPAKALAALKVHGFPEKDDDFFISNINRGFDAMGGELQDSWNQFLKENGKTVLHGFNASSFKLNIPVPPVDAIKQVAENGSSTDTGFVGRWTREEMLQAIETLQSIPAEQLENFSQWATVDSDRSPIEFQAALLVEGAKKNTPFSDYAYAQMGNRMAEENPAAATTWAKALPTGNARDLVFRGITARMYGKDPAQVEKWLAEQDPIDRRAGEQVIHHIRTVHEGKEAQPSQ